MLSLLNKSTSTGGRGNTAYLFTYSFICLFAFICSQFSYAYLLLAACNLWNIMFFFRGIFCSGFLGCLYRLAVIRHKSPLCCWLWLTVWKTQYLQCRLPWNLGTVKFDCKALCSPMLEVLGDFDFPTRSIANLAKSQRNHKCTFALCSLTAIFSSCH